MSGSIKKSNCFKNILLMFAFISFSPLAYAHQIKTVSDEDVAFFLGGIVVMAENCNLYSKDKINSWKKEQKASQVENGMDENTWDEAFDRGVEEVKGYGWEGISEENKKQECEKVKLFIGSE